MRDKCTCKRKLEYNHPPSPPSNDEVNDDNTVTESEGKAADDNPLEPGRSPSSPLVEKTLSHTKMEITQIPSEGVITESQVILQQSPKERSPMMALENEENPTDISKSEEAKDEPTNNVNDGSACEECSNVSSEDDEDGLEVIGYFDKSTVVPVEVTISSDDEDDTAVILRLQATQKRYNLRKNPTQVSSPWINQQSDRSFSRGNSDVSEEPPLTCSAQTSCTPLEVTSLTQSELWQFPNNNVKSCWLYNPFNVINNRKHIFQLKKYFQLYGGVVEHLHWIVGSRSNKTTSESAVCFMLSQTYNLRKITLVINTNEDLRRFVFILRQVYRQGHLSRLSSLQLKCGDPGGCVESSGVASLIGCRIPFQELELENFRYEEDRERDPHPLEELLETYKDTLTSFTLALACRDIHTKERAIRLTLPQMDNLRTLVICPTERYSFPKLQSNETEEEMDDTRGNVRVEVIELPEDFRKLETLIVGSTGRIYDLTFSIVKKLKTFRCAFDWHCSNCIRLPRMAAENSEVFLRRSKVTTIQFPSSLKDPSVFPRFGKLFPNLECVWMDLPSQSVLHSFFIHFASSKLKELRLQFQFGFASMLESCLFPQHVNSTSQPTQQRLVHILKQYKWSDDYCSHFSVELPLEDEDSVPRSAEGLGALKCLKRFHLTFVGREPLRIPEPDEERRWDDPECQFLKDGKISFTDTTGYPLSFECHSAIVKLNLDEYITNNCQIPTEQNETIPQGIQDDSILMSSQEDVDAVRNEVELENIAEESEVPVLSSQDEVSLIILNGTQDTSDNEAELSRETVNEEHPIGNVEQNSSIPPVNAVRNQVQLENIAEESEVPLFSSQDEVSLIILNGTQSTEDNEAELSREAVHEEHPVGSVEQNSSIPPVNEEDEPEVVAVFESSPTSLLEIVILSDDDEEEDTLQPESRADNLRRNRKRRVIYSDSSDSEEVAKKSRPDFISHKSDNISGSFFSVTSLPLAQLQELIDSEDATLKNPVWHMDTASFRNPHIRVTYGLLEMFIKYGGILKHLHWAVENFPSAEDKQKSGEVFISIMKHTTHVKTITLWYSVQEDVADFVDNLEKLYKAGPLKSLTSLQLISYNSTAAGIGKAGLEALVRSGIPFQELELGEFQPEDGVEESLQRFWETCKDSLTSITIGRGFVGVNSRVLKIKFPRMKNLRTLVVADNTCNSFEDKENPIGIEFAAGDLSNLRNLTLGSSVHIEDLPFSTVMRLKTFACKNQWNRSVQFPGTPSVLFLQRSKITSLTFPTKLKDASFVSKVAKFFPNLKSVCLHLPSQSVLRSFFQHFASSSLVELSLFFHFDFHLTLEPCLFPEHFNESKRTQSTRRHIAVLKKYARCDEFCEHYDVELPLKDSVGSEGLNSLKCLQKFRLEYIGREPMLLPQPTETLRWDDPDCQFLKSRADKISFSTATGYPLARECHKRIKQLHLKQYKWRNCQIPERRSRKDCVK